MMLWLTIALVLVLLNTIWCESLWEVEEEYMAAMDQLSYGENLIYAVVGDFNYHFQTMKTISETGKFSHQCFSMLEHNADTSRRINDFFIRNKNDFKAVFVTEVELTSTENVNKLNFLFHVTDSLSDEKKLVVILFFRTDDGSRFKNRTLLSSFFNYPSKAVNGHALVGRISKIIIEEEENRKNLSGVIAYEGKSLCTYLPNKSAWGGLSMTNIMLLLGVVFVLLMWMFRSKGDNNSTPPQEILNSVPVSEQQQPPMRSISPVHSPSSTSLSENKEEVIHSIVSPRNKNSTRHRRERNRAASHSDNEEAKSTVIGSSSSSHTSSEATILTRSNSVSSSNSADNSNNSNNSIVQTPRSSTSSKSLISTPLLWLSPVVESVNSDDHEDSNANNDLPSVKNSSHRPRNRPKTPTNRSPILTRSASKKMENQHRSIISMPSLSSTNATSHITTTAAATTTTTTTTTSVTMLSITTGSTTSSATPVSSFRMTMVSTPVITPRKLDVNSEILSTSTTPTSNSTSSNHRP